MPKVVDRYYDDAKKSNPDYTEAQAWALAWSRYCAYKNPGSKHCKKEPHEYFPGRKQAYEYDRRVASQKFQPGSRVQINESHGVREWHGDKGSIDKYIPFGKYYVEMDNGDRRLVDESNLDALRASLSLAHGKPLPGLSAQLATAKLYARSNGSLNDTLLQAAFYAKKHGKVMYVYAGNSYMTAVWRSTFKMSDVTSYINNTGNTVYSVAPDLTVEKYDVVRHT